MDWQPIETAPKDGTWVLIYPARDDNGVIEAAFDHNGIGMWLDRYGMFEDPYKGNAHHPTHWMPLPPPPQ